ncbi:hypothetical protein Pelo_16684 [Pelomyxa schiedti]|nr:hypothetical protein Pelo_16684 [Pelomyxa schiedti]
MGHTDKRNKGATTAELSKHQGPTSTHLHSRFTSLHTSPSISHSNPALHHSLGSFTATARQLTTSPHNCQLISEIITKIPKKLHSVEERAGEDTETSSKKIPWLIFSFLFSTLCDLDQTLLADICAHCTFAIALATSNAKPGCVVALNQKQGKERKSVGGSGLWRGLPKPPEIRQKRKIWIRKGTLSQLGGFTALSLWLLAAKYPPNVSLSCFEINDPTSAVLLGFCWSSFCFCPLVAIALGVANDPVAASQVHSLAVELCVWLFSGLRACALHMIGNDALFTFHYSCFWLSQHYCWIALSALTADLKVLGNCQTQKIECLVFVTGSVAICVNMLCCQWYVLRWRVALYVDAAVPIDGLCALPRLLSFCRCMLMWIMAELPWCMKGSSRCCLSYPRYLHTPEIPSIGTPRTSRSAQIPHQISFRQLYVGSAYCLAAPQSANLASISAFFLLWPLSKQGICFPPSWGDPISNFSSLETACQVASSEEKRAIHVSKRLVRRRYSLPHMTCGPVPQTLTWSEYRWKLQLNVDGRGHTPAKAQTSSSPVIITFTFAVPGDHAHLWKRYRRGPCQIEYGPRQEMDHNWHVQSNLQNGTNGLLEEKLFQLTGSGDGAALSGKCGVIAGTVTLFFPNQYSRKCIPSLGV